MDRVTTIDVSKKKGRRITESIIESVCTLKQDMMLILSSIDEMVTNPNNQTSQHCLESFRRVDDDFSKLYSEVDNLIVTNTCIQKFKANKEPIYKFIEQMMILIPIKVYHSKEISAKSLYEIHFVYRDLFYVKFLVKYKNTYFKPKDIAFFSLSELNKTVYSSDLHTCDKDISSMALFRQMTFAGKRFIRYSISSNKPDALEVIKWIDYYQDLLTATCVLCHNQLVFSGSDSFCIPSLRHFETGMPYHQACCKGENLLRT